MVEIKVLDTNVLIHDPNAFHHFKGSRIIIPMTVIEEVDKFKKGVDEKGRNARQINRYLDKLRDQGSLQEGVSIENGSVIQVMMSKRVEETNKEVILSDVNDNLIIGSALYVKKNQPQAEVTLISKDANVRIKADAVGLKSTDYKEEQVKFDELFTGNTNLEVDQEMITEFIQNQQLQLLTMVDPSTQKEEKLMDNQKENPEITSSETETTVERENYRNDNQKSQSTTILESGREKKLYPNQFVTLYNKNNKEEFYVTRYNYKQKTLTPLKFYKDQELIFGIKARNNEQKMAFELLLNDEVQMVSLIGKAGTGKTLLAMAAGLHKVVEENKYSRLVISRPISPLGKDIGYLPGSKMEKFNPWMQPIYDNMDILIQSHDEPESNKSGKLFNKKRTSLEDYLDTGFIELEPLTYIRGRSLPDQFIIIDEAQNLTSHEMKTIVTRAGERTKIVLTGDPYQIDIPYLDSESNGLSMSVEKLKSEIIIGHITLEKGERSQLADIAARHF